MERLILNINQSIDRNCKNSLNHSKTGRLRKMKCQLWWLHDENQRPIYICDKMHFSVRTSTCSMYGKWWCDAPAKFSVKTRRISCNGTVYIIIYYFLHFIVDYFWLDWKISWRFLICCWLRWIEFAELVMWT